MLTEWAAWRRARWRVLLLTGVAAIGKATLLAALARDDSLRHHFRNGILWLRGTGTDLLEQATLQVGLRDSPTTRAGEWARWAGDPNRRLLVILDDALPDEGLERLIAPAGPQVVFALTTQKAPEIRAALERWIPRNQIGEVLLQGMREEEGLALIQRVQERPLGEGERETARRVADILGWHPEGLRLAAGMAEEQGGGWEAVLAFLEEGLRGGEWDPLFRLLERQWERIGPERRERVERLVWRTVRGGPLEEPLAGAVWDVKPEVARLILRDLERIGLVERVAVHPAEWWRPQEVVMWRVTPIVFQVRREEDPTGRWKNEHQRWRNRVVFRRDWAAGYVAPPMPLSFALVAALFHVLGVLLKATLWAGLALWGALTGREEAFKRWERWTTAVTPITNLRGHLAQRGVWISEELELLIGRSDQATKWVLRAELGAAVAVAWASLRPYDWLLLVPFVIGIALFLAWFTWLSVLYGVRTWDLALAVRLALALTAPLRGLAPVRRERERLREAWDRGSGRR